MDYLEELCDDNLLGKWKDCKEIVFLKKYGDMLSKWEFCLRHVNGVKQRFMKLYMLLG